MFRSRCSIGISQCLVNGSRDSLCFPQICARGTIFARMSPDQKSQLVEQLQGIG